MNTLAFPQLGIELTVKRYFEIFGFRIYWYGVIIAVGFILALVYCLRRAARFRIKQDDIIDIALIAMPLAIIGARIMYVACNWNEFKGDFWSVFKIWNGGIAIYGGLILAIAGVA
ncbi:MAG: prolipoprotein diacylglyceryl transferase, partial [Eubacteriales bacterium]